MLDWVLNMPLDRNILRFFNNIMYYFDTNSNTVSMYEAELDLGDILLTYKMELFVTICLFKVTFCRLMISYIQYCPMSIFSCVSLLLVPFRCRWFHLKTSEMVLFVTIAIPNAVFYWAMVLHAVSYYEFLVFCVSSLLSPSR